MPYWLVDVNVVPGNGKGTDSQENREISCCVPDAWNVYRTPHSELFMASHQQHHMKKMTSGKVCDVWKSPGCMLVL